ncbi:MAG: hypothetical protein Q4P66_00380 [Actinomycetaceae bacterium]|nr:hypothetical protein [Actinomycetaceae bacterium]
MTDNDPQCPVPGAHDVHETMIDFPIVWTAGFFGATTTLFYSLPDYLRCPVARFVAKTGILASQMAWMFHKEQRVVPRVADLKNHGKLFPLCPVRHDDPFGIDELEAQADAIAATTPSRVSAPIVIGPFRIPRVCVTHTGYVAAGVAGIAAVGATVEHLIFRRAEKRCDRGVVMAHTRQAVVLGAVVAACVAVLERLVVKSDR